MCVIVIDKSIEILLDFQSEYANRKFLLISNLCVCQLYLDIFPSTYVTNFSLTLSRLLLPRNATKMTMLITERNKTSGGHAKECRNRMCVHTYIVDGVTHLSIISMFHMPRTSYGNYL